MSLEFGRAIVLKSLILQPDRQSKLGFKNWIQCISILHIPFCVAQFIACFDVFYFAAPGKANSPTKISSTTSAITLRLSHLNTGSYTLTWKPPSNNGTKTGIAGTSTIIDNLTSNTAYSFTAKNSAGTGKPSDPVTIATGLFKRK